MSCFEGLYGNCSADLKGYDIEKIYFLVLIFYVFVDKGN